MNRIQRIINKRTECVEDTALMLINTAERFALTAERTLWDQKCIRQSLLEAGRAYGNAVRALAKPIR
jgi:hypothetical protein